MTILLLTLLFSYPDSARVIGRMYYSEGISGNYGARTIVRDSLHRIHFVYSKKWGLPYADSSEIYYRYSQDNGVMWSQEENISRTGSAVSGEPCLVIDKNDILHCFWKQYVPNGIGSYEIFHCKKDSTGWSTPTRLTYQYTTTNALNHISAVIDSQNQVRVAWSAPPNNTVGDIWYSVLNDSGFTLPYNVTNSLTGTGGPSLGIDTLDHLHLCYGEYINGLFKQYYQKYDNIIWSIPYYLTWQLEGEGDVTLTVDTKSRIHCVLSQGPPGLTQSEIYYICYTDTGGWSYPINISENPSTFSVSPNVACDSLDNLYIVWQERMSGYTYDIYYRTFNGVTWSPVINLTNDPSLSSIPKLGHPVTRSGVDLIWSNRISSYPPVYDVVYMQLRPIASGIEEPEIPRRIISPPQPLIKITPNPFNYQTIIQYTLPVQLKFSIKLYDINGKLIEVLTETEKQPGTYQIVWHNKKFPAGVYFLSLETKEKKTIERLVVIK